MTPADALAELATLSPPAVELVDLIRKAQRGGLPPRKALDTDERRMPTIRVIRAALAAEPTRILSRSQLLIACRNVGPAKVLAAALFDLEVTDEIRVKTNTGPNGGRPPTLHIRII